MSLPLSQPSVTSVTNVLSSMFEISLQDETWREIIPASSCCLFTEGIIDHIMFMIVMTCWKPMNTRRPGPLLLLRKMACAGRPTDNVLAIVGYDSSGWHDAIRCMATQDWPHLFQCICCSHLWSKISVFRLLVKFFTSRSLALYSSDWIPILSLSSPRSLSFQRIRLFVHEK